MAASVTTGPGGAERTATSDAGRLLADAVHEWARARFGEAGTAHIATGAAECAWCPICQLIAALRGERPDVTDKLVRRGRGRRRRRGLAAEPTARSDLRPGRRPAGHRDGRGDGSSG